MQFNSLISRFKVPSKFLLLSCLLISCDRQKESPERKANSSEKASPATALHSNNLTNPQSSLMKSQAKSPVHWQNWGKHVFEHAKSNRKTIFVFIGPSNHPDSHLLLERINQSPSTYHSLNRNHINVLIDSNCNPEMEYFTSHLSGHSDSRYARPMLLWLSYEGNPISWSPTSASSTNSISDVLNRMTQTVNQLWRDGPDYVLKNSQSDYLRRQQKGMNTRDIPDAQIRQKLISNTRRLASLYDPTSNTIDKLGNFHTQKFIKVLTMASISGAIPGSQRIRYAGIARLAAQKILIQSLMDPVDGGVWDGKQRTTHALPVFSKSLLSQVQALHVLFLLYQQTEDDIYLKAAKKIHAFTEQHLKQSGGDYSEAIAYSQQIPADNPCLVTLEELEQLLTEQELRISKLAFGIRGLGNVPLMDDPNRAYFRKNTLNWKISKSELAEKIQMPQGKIDEVIESVAKKLSKSRNESPDSIIKENMTTARSLAAYSSAMVTAYRATGSAEYLNQAKSLFQSVHQGFTDAEGILRQAKFSGQLVRTPASAQARATLCAAALDLHDATQDATYLESAKQIHQDLMTRLFLKEDNMLIEQDYSGYPTEYKISMIANIPTSSHGSSVALTWSNISRLLMRSQNQQLMEQQASLASQLNAFLDNPISIIIDYLACYSHIHQPTVGITASVKPALAEVAMRRPCHIITFPTNTSSSESIPPDGSVRIYYEDKAIGTTDNASELRSLLK